MEEFGRVQAMLCASNNIPTQRLSFFLKENGRPFGGTTPQHVKCQNQPL
jgi:hypothetical protein